MQGNLQTIKTDLESLGKWIDEKIKAFGTAGDAAKTLAGNLTFFNSVWDVLKETILGINQREEDIRNMTIDEFFSCFGHVDQGALSYLEENSEEYKRIKKLIKEKYRMSDRDAEILLRCLNSIGACTYGSLADAIVNQFRNSPGDFERTFGFSMYKIDKNGNMVLNREELLIDMYIFANTGNQIFGIESSIDDGLGKRDSIFNYDVIEKRLKIDEDLLGYNEDGELVFLDQMYLNINLYNMEAVIRGKTYRAIFPGYLRQERHILKRNLKELVSKKDVLLRLMILHLK